MSIKLRQQVLERDNFTCQQCKAKDKKLGTHHIVARRYGGTDTLDNLITYCYSCHGINEPSTQMKAITNPLFVEKKSNKLHQTAYERITRRISYYGETLDQILTRILDSLDDYEQQKQSKNHKK